MKRWLPIWMLFMGFVVAPSGARADLPYCPYQAFTPTAVYPGLIRAFNRSGISVLPDGFLPDHPGQAIVRAGVVVGTLRMEKNVRKGTAGLMLFDVNGEILATLTERVAPCPKRFPRGMCEISSLQTEIGETENAAGPEFEAAWTPGGLYLTRYGQSENPVVWRGAFREAMRWVVNTYVDSSEGKSLTAATPEARLHLALALDPHVFPYLPGIRFYAVGGMLRVSGRVPSNYVYGRVLSAARSLGMTVRPDLIIDTRLKVPALSPRYYGCGFDIY